MSKTRLLDAAKKIDLESVRTILAAKPALRAATDRGGMNLLHLACAVSPKKLRVRESAPIPLVNFLLDQGLTVDEQVPSGSGKGCTALWFAVGRGRNLTLARHLIARGADPRKAPGGGLYAAGWYEDLKILDLLIDNGASIDIIVGVTPFLACWYWKKFNAARHLAKRGADVNYRDPKKGKTALHYGVEKEFDPALLKWLVARGASADIEDSAGVTARARALRKRDARWARALEAPQIERTS